MDTWQKITSQHTTITENLNSAHKTFGNSTLNNPKSLKLYLTLILSESPLTPENLSYFLLNISKLTNLNKNKSIFDKNKLNLLFLILEENEHLIMKTNKNLKFFLQIIFNLREILVFAFEEIVDHVVRVLKDIKLFGFKQEKDQIGDISGFILTLAKHFKDNFQKEFKEKFIVKNLKNFISGFFKKCDIKSYYYTYQSTNDEEEVTQDKIDIKEAINFWVHKLVETGYKDDIMNSIISNPVFLLNFDLKNVI